MGVRNSGRALTVGVAAAFVVAVFAGPAAADVDVDVVMDGRDAAGMDVNDPLILEADEPVEIALAITNTGDEEVFVRSVRLRSQVIGLTFVAYETRVDVPVPAGETAERTFQLDLLDLRSQATGLLPADVELLDPNRNQLAVVPLTVDVQGSFWSVYGGFALAVGALTAVVLARNLVRLGQGRLPVNRWTRGGYFGAPGVGVGLVATFTLSALRIFSPAPAVWSTLVLGFGVGLFVVGYLTPTPGDDDEELDLDDLEDEELAGHHPARPTAGPDERPPTQRAAPRTVGDDPERGLRQ